MELRIWSTIYYTWLSFCIFFSDSLLSDFARSWEVTKWRLHIATVAQRCCLPMPALLSAPPSSESDTSPISPLRDGRRRKNRDSSEDSDSVELPDGLINEDLRAGGPYLCAIPTRSVSLRGTPIFNQIEHRMQHLVQKISQILHSYRITTEALDICGRISRIDPEPAVIPTVFIVTPARSIDSKWVDACRQLLDFFRKEALPQFSVEIACRRAFESPCYFPVKRTDAIYPVWHQVLDCIFKDVELTGINAIECFRVGYNVNQDESQPTIVVSVNRRLSRNWKYIRERIVHIINSMSLWSVGVSIGPGEVLRHIAFPLDGFKAEAQAGLNLGIHGSEKSAGTLSGWIEIEHPRTKGWQKFALTCFHCVDPGTSSVHSSQQNRECPSSASAPIRAHIFRSEILANQWYTA